MLQSCEGSQICTIHKIVMFDQNPKEGKDGTSDPNPTKGNLYYVPTRNPRTGRLEVNTHPKMDFYLVSINEVGPQTRLCALQETKFAGFTHQQTDQT